MRRLAGAWPERHEHVITRAVGADEHLARTGAGPRPDPADLRERRQVGLLRHAEAQQGLAEHPQAPIQVKGTGHGEPRTPTGGSPMVPGEHYSLLNRRSSCRWRPDPLNMQALASQGNAASGYARSPVPGQGQASSPSRLDLWAGYGQPVYRAAVSRHAQQVILQGRGVVRVNEAMGMPAHSPASPAGDFRRRAPGGPARRAPRMAFSAWAPSRS